MSVGYPELRDAQYRALGLNPVFTAQGYYPETVLGVVPNGKPAVLTDGTSMATPNGGTDYILAVPRVQLRRVAKYHSAYYTVTLVDVVSTYRIVVGAVNNDYAANPGDVAADIYAGLLSALAVNGFSSEITTYRGSVLCLRVWDSTTEANVAFTEAIIGGAGTADIEVEATSVTFCIWLASDSLPTFDVPEGLESFTRAFNWKQRLEISGDAYMYVELTASDGYTVVDVGLCGLPL